jgi:hypothetical protein
MISLISSDPRIVAWVYGHTHTGVERGKFYSHPFGYRGENANGNKPKVFQIILKLTTLTLEPRTSHKKMS